MWDVGPVRLSDGCVKEGNFSVLLCRSRTPQPPAEDEEECIDDTLVTMDTCEQLNYTPDSESKQMFAVIIKQMIHQGLHVNLPSKGPI